MSAYANLLTYLGVRCIMQPIQQEERPLTMGQESLKGNMPTLILAVLEDHSLHGYAVAREIERRSGNVLQCKEGTLYPALHSLEREGLLCGEWCRLDNGRERKLYHITPAGLAALESHRRQWRLFT